MKADYTIRGRILVWKKGMPLEHIALIIIRDAADHFFVHRRASSKSVYPGLYGLGAGGRVEPDEDSRHAARRELLEETGLTTSVDFLFHIDYPAAPPASRIYVFETRVDRSISITPSAREWDWSGWMPLADVDALVASESLCPDTIAVFMRYRDRAIVE